MARVNDEVACSGVDTSLFVHGKRKEKARRVAELLCEDARMPLSVMSRRTGLPVSTLFDVLKDIRRHYCVRGVFVPKREPDESGSDDGGGV